MSLVGRWSLNGRDLMKSKFDWFIFALVAGLVFTVFGMLADFLGFYA